MRRLPIFSAIACALIAASSQAATPLTLNDLTLSSPALAQDEESVVLVWQQPSKRQHIVDYRLYQNGQSLGLASANNAQHNPAAPYFNAFYERDKTHFNYSIRYQNFMVTGLKPTTQYQFQIAAVYEDGQESALSAPLSITTPTYAHTVDVAQLGAKGDGKTLNTKAIQTAIDQCASQSTNAYGCRVLIAPSDSGATYVTGALFLHSNMTLEIAKGATLKGSPYAKDYPLQQGYQLYSFRTNATDSRRPPSLLNTLAADHRNGENHSQQGYDHRMGTFENIRIVGQGTLDGSGWQQQGTTLDEAGQNLAYHPPGGRDLVYSLGILAKDQMIAAYREYHPNWDGDTNNIEYQGQFNKDIYANRRSALATFRGVNQLYFAGLTLLNPAYHGIMFLDSENTTMAYTRTETFDINNADGVEFGNSSDFAVFANFIDSGDDCINFAAGQGKNYQAGTESVHSTERGWVFNNYTREGHGVLVAGSHTGAWIQDIVAENNVSFMTDNGLRLKSTLSTGGGVRRITFRENVLADIGSHNTHTALPSGVDVENRGGLGSPFVFTLAYKAGDNVFENAAQAAYFNHIDIDDVTVDNREPSSKPSILIDGYDGKDSEVAYPETWHDHLVFKQVTFFQEQKTRIDHLKDSVFEEVTFLNSDASPWKLSHSTNVKFVKVSPPYK